MPQRGFKFRVWNSVQKFWITQPDIALTAEGDILVFSNQEGVGNNYWDRDCYNGNRIYAVQQFTGLKDKNGVEIYEGDIVKSEIWHGPCKNWPNGGVEIHTGEVEFTIYGWNFRTLGMGGGLLRGSEIIGNIFETPELLK